MPVKILATGDLHIGRHSSKIPEDFDKREFSCGAMWGSIVDRAIREKVDLVLLSGDIVDQERDRYEAFDLLGKGLKKLEDERIQTIATAGNHDASIFQRLAHSLDSFDCFYFLGQKGEWTPHDFKKEGETLVRIHGWCFPAQHHYDNPLDNYALSPHEDPGVPTIGLLHADLNVPESPYAPVSLHDLQEHEDLSIWVLGHQHKHLYIEAQAGKPAVLYPGSPQAMDPGESGSHGPWILNIDEAKNVTCRHLPMSSARYDSREVDITRCEDLEDLQKTLAESASLYEKSESLSTQDPPPRLVFLRFLLKGESQVCQEYKGLHDNFYKHRIAGDCADIYVEDIDDQSRPPVDLDALAQRKDPAGVLARLLIDLDRDEQNPESNKLIDDCLAEIKDINQCRHYRDIGLESEPGPSRATQVLTQQARRLLIEISGQVEES